MTPPGDLDNPAKTTTHTPAARRGRVAPAAGGDRDRQSVVRGRHGATGPTETEARELLEVAKLGAQASSARGPDVDDVAQAVAEKLTRDWNALHVVAARARGRNGWHAYITVAARNAHRDLLRVRGRAVRRELRAAQLGGGPPHERPGVRRPRPDQASDVDRYLARRLLADLIEECPMTARQREVVALHLLDGLTSAEIAERLDLAVRTVSSHRRCAFKILRRELLHSQRRGQPA